MRCGHQPQSIDKHGISPTEAEQAFFDPGLLVRARLPNLKLTTTAISLQIPVSLLERIKVAAKLWPAEKLGGV